MSSGAKVISAFIRETVAGTTPASGDWSLLKRTSWGVKPTQNKGEPRFYVSTSKSIIKALINMHSFEIQLSPIG